MLPLDHPLWPRLGDAHRDRDVAGLIARLARNWDGPAANSLFWDCLCHQDTVYGATFAALPWVFRIARDSPEARDDCLSFVVYASMCALRDSQDLPRTVTDWQATLAVYRSLAARDAHNPRWQAVLDIGTVEAEDLPDIEQIRAGFRSLLPRVGAFCAAMLPNTQDESMQRCLLAGIALNEGRIRLAELLLSGDEGTVVCAARGGSFRYARFGDRVAVYPLPPEHPDQPDPGLEDWRSGAPDRASACVMPSETVPFPVPHGSTGTLLRAFLGTVTCAICSATTPLTGGPT
jgi:hypothetical protein